MTEPNPISAQIESRATRLALTFILVLTALRLAVLFASPLQLYPDEAQYWLWSRTLDFGYFSKPPMIAWAIWATTHIGGGDGEAFVRLSAPLFHAVAAIALFATGRTLWGAWAGLAAAVVYSLMPGVQQSSFTIATDAPLLCFLSLALLAYVTLQGTEGRTRHAVGLGVALGLAMLSKYAAIYAVIGIALHLILSREARAAWTPVRIGAAVLAFAVVLAPNLIWNATHHFATLEHTAANADLGGRLFNPGEMLTFVGEQFGVFGPVAFLTLIVGAVLAIRRRQIGEAELLLACWTLPALVVVTGQAFLSRANANWAASAYVAGSVLVAGILIQGLQGRHRKAAIAGLGGVLLIQGALAAFLLTAAAQPTVMDELGRSNDIKRVRGWEQMSEAVIRRAEIEAVNGGLTAIAVDDRFLFNAMAYYGRDYFARPDSPPLKIWVKGKPGNQAEVEAPLTPAVGGRVLVAALEDREGRKAARIGADFQTAQSVEIVSVLLSPKCRAKDGEKPEKFDHRCRRRATLILGEGFAPAPRPD